MADASLDWLYSLAQFGIKFGLGNIRAVLEALDNPHEAYRTLHVAGTNGKGSVTAIADTALRRAGHRVGRYTSPHLLDITERFVVDGSPVAQREMLAAVESVRAVVSRLQAAGTLDVHPTFFEITTAVAFELFRRRGVDIAVCEVGLGGRLDATNVLSPVATAITSIAFDHEQYLGHTLREIALEKAGIIKPGVPLVVGPLPDDAADTIGATATERQAPIAWAMAGTTLGTVRRSGDGHQRFTLATPVRDYGEVQLALAGAHQVTNAVVAVRLLEVAEARGVTIGREAIVDALETVEWPGRLEHVRTANGADVLLDAAHNAAGAARLAEYLSEAGTPRTLVFSAMRDKDVTSMLQAILPLVAGVVITRASNPRAHEPATLAALVRSIAPTLPVEMVESPEEALARASAGGAPVIVAGSIFLLADVMRGLRRS